MLFVSAYTIITLFMPFAVVRPFAFYIYPDPISASFTVFLIPGLAFFIILSCYASVVFIAFLIITTVTMLVRPAFFAFARLLAAVWRILTTVLIT
jgi:hypothetical protein